MSNVIISHGIGSVTVDSDTQAVFDRNAMIAGAACIKSVSCEFELENAVEVLRELKGLLKSTEESRRVVKEPVLDLGRRIDDVAKKFIAPIDVELHRLTKLVGDYQAAEQAKRMEAMRIQQIEQARIESERRRVEAAEAARLKAIADAQEAEELAFTSKERNEAQEAQKAAQAAQARIAETAAAIKSEQDRLALPVAQIAKPSGLVTKQVWKFEVLDVWALAASDRNLVRIEPNTQAINQVIKIGRTTIPGLRIWSETVTEVRS